MADFITKAQYGELKDRETFGDAAEFYELLKEYTGIEARPYTAYSYYSAERDYLGDSDEADLDELLQAACVEVRDG